MHAAARKRTPNPYAPYPPNSSILSPRSRGIHKHKSLVKHLNQVFTSTSHKSSIPTRYPQAQVTSQASGSLPRCRGSPAQVTSQASQPQAQAQVKHLDPYPIAEVHQHKSRIATPLQRFTSTSQASGSLPHCRGSPAQVKGSPPHCRGIHSISTPLQREVFTEHRNPIAEVFTASQPHCRGRYSQHLNPIAEGGIHSIATPLQRYSQHLNHKHKSQVKHLNHKHKSQVKHLNHNVHVDASLAVESRLHQDCPHSQACLTPEADFSPDLRSTCGTSDRERCIAQSTVKSQAVGGGMPAPAATSRSPSALPGSP